MFWGIHERAISQEVLMNLIHDMRWDIILLKLLPHLPGVDELIYQTGRNNTKYSKLKFNTLRPEQMAAIV